jgi:hypothetical protein
MPLSREEIELLSAYEQEMKALRNQLADGLYWGCRRALERYTGFVAEFGPEGRYASLAGQYAADSGAISAEEIAALVGAMEVIIATMESVEAKAPGLWGIPVPAPVVEEINLTPE